MKGRLLHAGLLQLTLLGILCLAQGPAHDLAQEQGWTRFRGPNGSGISKETGFPIEVGKSRNVMWRTPVRPGKSSPVLTTRHVFLTGYDKDKLITQCFDRATGRLLWERAENRTHKQDVNLLNNPAAITPVTDGENVYVFFKDLGLISYDATGGLRWKVPLGPFTNSMGLGASPIIAGDSIILVADQIGNSYIAAFDRRDGEIRWKTARQESEGWGTPLLYSPPGSAPLILTAGQGQYGAHRVSDGKRVFSHPGLSPGMVASPVLDHDTVYAFGYGADHGPSLFAGMLAQLDKNHDGQLTPDEYQDIPGDTSDHQMTATFTGMGKYMGNGDGIVTQDKWDAWGRHTGGPTGLLAVRLDGGGAAPRDLWRYDKGFAGVIPSPLLYDGVLYVIKNGGILTAFNPASGEVFKTGRVAGALGGYSSSPVAAEGRIFIVSEEGKLAVLRAGRDWEVLAVNDLGEGAFATPALSAGRIYLRTDEALYCFASKP
jgi:outer membrane protein assembly factor BamB